MLLHLTFTVPDLQSGSRVRVRVRVRMLLHLSFTVSDLREEKNTVFKIQDSRYQVIKASVRRKFIPMSASNSRFKIQDSRFKIQDSRFIDPNVMPMRTSWLSCRVLKALVVIPR